MLLSGRNDLFLLFLLSLVNNLIKLKKSMMADCSKLNIRIQGCIGHRFLCE